MRLRKFGPRNRSSQRDVQRAKRLQTLPLRGETEIYLAMCFICEAGSTAMPLPAGKSPPTSPQKGAEMPRLGSTTDKRIPFPLQRCAPAAGKLGYQRLTFVGVQRISCWLLAWRSQALERASCQSASIGAAEAVAPSIARRRGSFQDVRFRATASQAALGQ